jgi:hypothetical protein
MFLDNLRSVKHRHGKSHRGGIQLSSKFRDSVGYFLLHSLTTYCDALDPRALTASSFVSAFDPSVTIVTF